MSGSLAAVVEGVAALAGGGVGAGVASVWTRRPRPYALGTHAVATSGARDPLARPLRQGYAAATVAVRLDAGDRLQVGDEPARDEPGNAIGPLVLRPLAERAAGLGGRVHPGQRGPFILMVDILEPSPARAARAYQRLDAELRRHPELFTRVTDGIVLVGPVMVVLTGANIPRAVVDAQPDRMVLCDGTVADIGLWGAPASLVAVVSEHCAWRFGWDGRGDMPAEERHQLRGLVQVAQGEGRRVRFFGVPARPRRIRDAYWRELHAAGVDLITTTDLPALARLRGRPAPGARRPTATAAEMEHIIR
jgi:hypothetical protein